jgi:hypothetical protein
MWCVSALAMCCASSEIKRCVIVMVQLYCCVFTFIVFVGDGWMALVPTYLPHLKLMLLRHCVRVRDKYIEDILAAASELVVIDCQGKVVGGMGSKQLEAVCIELEADYRYFTKDSYGSFWQHTFDWYIRRQQF